MCDKDHVATGSPDARRRCSWTGHRVAQASTEILPTSSQCARRCTGLATCGRAALPQNVPMRCVGNNRNGVVRPDTQVRRLVIFNLTNEPENHGRDFQQLQFRTRSAAGDWLQRRARRPTACGAGRVWQIKTQDQDSRSEWLFSPAAMKQCTRRQSSNAICRRRILRR